MSLEIALHRIPTQSATAPRKRTEYSIEESRRLEGLGQLAGQVAHDFNNLLYIINLNTDRLLESDDEDSSRQKRLLTIRNASRRGSEVINSLLSVARRQPLKPIPVDIVNHVHLLYPLLVSACGRNCRIEIAETSKSYWVETDPGGLSATILNLVINARAAMPTGGLIKICFGATRRSPPIDASNQRNPILYNSLEVIDTGSGMSSEVKRRAFEPFFTTKETGGSGLGLATVYGFARQCNGFAEIDSEVDRGTRVKLYLPAVGVPVPANVSLPTGPNSSNRTRILIVDDEPDLVEELRYFLQLKGFDVTTAATAEVALEILTKKPFDILLSDVSMPGMDGFALAQKASELANNLRIILMSGFAMRSSEKQLRWHVVQKPIDSEKLIDLLKSLPSLSA